MKSLNRIEKLSSGFIGVEEHRRILEETKAKYERQLEEMKNADAWRLNPHPRGEIQKDLHCYASSI